MYIEGRESGVGGGGGNCRGRDCPASITPSHSHFRLVEQIFTKQLSGGRSRKVNHCAQEKSSYSCCPWQPVLALVAGTEWDKCCMVWVSARRRSCSVTPPDTAFKDKPGTTSCQYLAAHPSPHFPALQTAALPPAALTAEAETDYGPTGSSDFH